MTLQSAGAASVADLGPWFHNLHLPDGRQTAPDHPLGDFPAFKWRDLAPHLPEDLSGRRALDIGCNAGFYAFELARRGAAVVAIDSDEHYLRQARWAAEQFRLTVDFRCASVYDLARWDEQFDLVLFLGVFYHLRYPVLALDLVVEKTRDLLVFQTLTTPDDDVAEQPEDLDIGDRDRLLEAGWPRMTFVEHRLAGDPTNWWVPNAAAVEALLRTAGVDVIARPGHEIWLGQATRCKNARTASMYATGAST
jgi:tRNA (mo5U34)-methyltransferase